jgi:hypothetical protein
MSPRRSFPIGVTARSARERGTGTAALKIQEPSPPAPAAASPLRASNDNGGDAGACFKQPCQASRDSSADSAASFFRADWLSTSVVAGLWRSIS